VRQDHRLADDQERAARAAGQMRKWADEHGQWRTGTCINLIAANNVMSPSARMALASRLADKPISGALGRRHHMGGHYVDLIETSVVELAQELFHVTTVEYRPMSGNLANAVAVYGLLRAGDTALTLPAGAPCHQSHRAPCAHLGVRMAEIPFDYKELDVDLEGLRRVTRAERPRLIMLGTQQMLFPYSLGAIRAIADEVGALVLYDGAHPLGLIAGGQFQDPLSEGAHLLTGSTQKTLPGPIGGLVMTRDERLGKAVAEATSELFSNYHNNRVLSLGITLAEMVAFGRPYADACVANARALASALAAEGIRLLGAHKGYTRSNQLIVDLSEEGDARSLAHAWERANLMTTLVKVPSSSVRSGQPPNALRIGVQEVTRLGMGATEMETIASLMGRVTGGEAPERVGKETAEFASRYQQVYYCFEGSLPRRMIQNKIP
jgi:glycine hydroxymethyltransferase